MTELQKTVKNTERDQYERQIWSEWDEKLIEISKVQEIKYGQNDNKKKDERLWNKKVSATENGKTREKIRCNKNCG